MRDLINLFENLTTSPFVIDDRFVAKVQKYLHDHLADWADDFPNLKAAIEQTWRLIDEEGVPENGGIEVYREELRPANQIADKNFGSLGACWSWDIDGTGTLHHDNAYDEHGRDVQPIIFVATVALRDVDWVQTIAKNLVLKREREINIKDGASVNVEGIMPKGKMSYPHGEGFSAQISNINEF